MIAILDMWESVTVSQAKEIVVSVSGVVEGSLLVAFVSSDTDSIPGTYTGWTKIYDNPSGSGFSTTSAYYKVATGSEPSSYTWSRTTGINAHWACTILSLSGTNTTTPVVSYSTNEAYSSSPISSTITPNANNAMILSLFSIDNDSATTMTLDGTLTLQSEVKTTSKGDNGVWHKVGYLLQTTAAATGTITHTLSPSGEWNNGLIAIESSGGGIQTNTAYLMNMMRG